MPIKRSQTQTMFPKELLKVELCHREIFLCNLVNIHGVCKKNQEINLAVAALSHVDLVQCAPTRDMLSRYYCWK